MSYPKETKIALVREYEQGKPVAEIAESSGIPRSSIYHWIREYQKISTQHAFFTPSEHHKLQAHCIKMENIMDIVRLTGCISALPIRKRLQVAETIYNSHKEYSVREICAALEIDRGTFYNHIFRRRDTSQRDEKEAQLMQTVQQIFDESGQRYGANRIMRTMQAQGIPIKKQHVLDIMHELGLEAVCEGAKGLYKQRREQRTNRIKREFSVDKPNKVWVSDITYFNCNGAPVYLCVVIDLYSRMIVGYAVSQRQSKQIVSSALKKAIEFRNPPTGLVFHSDRGLQYTSKAFQCLLKENGMIQSLSASGRPYDNAVAEAFFSTLKKEELYRNQYKGIHGFKTSVANYIEFYNKTRTHSYLGYLSPVQFETKFSSKK